MITQSFDLNLIPKSSPVVVHCDQYDKGTGRLVISLYDESIAYSPSGTAKIQGTKPDGKGFEYDASISGNVVTANLTEQMTAVAGRVRCQIVVTESTGRTGTFAFILDVQPSALPLDTDISESDYQFIEQAIEAAQDAEESSEDSEAWAVGERGGVPVDPSDETYHNNAKWWAEQSAGGATSLADLTDVHLTSPTNGQSLVYDDATDKWVNGDGGASAFADLTDVAISNLTNGQIPQYNSTSQKWENTNLPTIPDDINDLSDVVVSSAQNGQGLIYDSATSKWKNQNIPSGGASDLDDLGDVVISSATNGQVLEYNSGTNKWSNASLPSIPDEITDMSDVSVSSVQNGQVLKYNTTSQKWENANESGGGASDLDDLSDVSISSPTNGQVLKYNSTSQEWENANESGGGGGMNTDGSNADASIVFPSNSISSGAYSKSSGGLAFCNEQAATSDLTNSLQSIPANTTTETRILNIHINSHPVVNIWLESSNKVTATKDMTSDVTKTYNNATIRVHKEGNYIEVWATNTNSSSVYCHYTRQSYTESNHDSLSVGKATKATGDSSVSTGIATEATGKASYAGGYHSSTNKDYAHAEGFSTRAEGVGAFSIGSNSAAKGNFSFAQGSDTRASSVNQAAFGKYNIEDTQDTYAFLIGNGTSNTRANALSVDWDGNLEVAGNVKGKFNKVTTFAVDLTGWTSDTTSQSGTTLYKKQISLNNVYVESPTVDIGASGVLPTVAEQESYDLLQYVTVDDTVPCLYLYASAIPITAFYIKVEGVD